MLSIKLRKNSFESGSVYDILVFVLREASTALTILHSQYERGKGACLKNQFTGDQLDTPPPLSTRLTLDCTVDEGGAVPNQ